MMRCHLSSQTELRLLQPLVPYLFLFFFTWCPVWRIINHYGDWITFCGKRAAGKPFKVGGASNLSTSCTFSSTAGAGRQHHMTNDCCNQNYCKKSRKSSGDERETQHRRDKWASQTWHPQTHTAGRPFTVTASWVSICQFRKTSSLLTTRPPHKASRCAASLRWRRSSTHYSTGTWEDLIISERLINLHCYNKKQKDIMLQQMPSLLLIWQPCASCRSSCSCLGLLKWSVCCSACGRLSKSNLSTWMAILKKLEKR